MTSCCRISPRDWSSLLITYRTCTYGESEKCPLTTISLTKFSRTTTPTRRSSRRSCSRTARVGLRPFSTATSSCARLRRPIRQTAFHRSIPAKARASGSYQSTPVLLHLCRKAARIHRR
ncbi:unnamed protein product [Amoebophrya sp. A120]|nr:unnamed protein product [Amoebophrya sp. A120]|eukprot:GSA120T00004224001.1